MIVGDLVKRKNPIPDFIDEYGIIVRTTETSIFVHWMTNNYTSGYNDYDIHNRLEVISV